MEEQKEHVEGIRQAFKSKFERFADLRSTAGELKLATAQSLSRDLAEFAASHLLGAANDSAIVFGPLVSKMSVTAPSGTTSPVGRT